MKKKEKKSATKKPGGPRRRGFAVENLSEEGLALVNEMLGSTSPYYKLDEIVSGLKKKTGEKLSRSALDRYYRKVWKKKLEEESNEQARIIDIAKSILSVVKEIGDSDTEEMAGRLITAGLLSQSKEIREADPIRLLKEERERIKLDILREQLEVDKQKVALLREKIKQAASNVKKVVEEAVGRSLTAEQSKRIDEEVYGIVTD